MDPSQLQSLWQQHETALTAQRQLNLHLLREINLGQAKASLRRLLFLPVSSLLFFGLVAAYALHFLFLHGQAWYYLVSGSLVLLFSTLLVLASIRQLYRLLTVDFQAPVVTLQRKLARLKSVMVDGLRIAAWALAFAPFFGVFIAQALFGFDLVANQATGLTGALFVLSLVLGLGAWLFSRALRPGNLHQQWINWLLAGSGSQVEEAMGFLGEIQAFEAEGAAA
jgi:hypothetical protein